MATSLGFSPQNASFLISMVGITNTVGRVISGWVTDIPSVSPLVVTIIATLVGGIFPVLMPIGGSYTTVMVICGLFGFVISALPTVTTGVIVDMLGIRYLNSAFGKHFINNISLLISRFQVLSRLSVVQQPC